MYFDKTSQLFYNLLDTVIKSKKKTTGNCYYTFSLMAYFRDHSYDINLLQSLIRVRGILGTSIKKSLLVITIQQICLEIRAVPIVMKCPPMF